MKVTIKGIIKESNDNKQRYYDKVSKVIHPPYLRDLISLGVPPDEWKPILSIVNEVSAILVAITTFLAPLGVGSNIFAYKSVGKLE